MTDDGNRDAPPGECGVEACRQEPSAEKIPNLGRFIAALLRSEDAGDTGKVNAAKRNCQNSRPAQTGEFEIA